MTTVIASAPGRTEIAGNHQDHQGGSIIAAAIDKRIQCKATLTDRSSLKVQSKGFDPFELGLSDPDLLIPQPGEFNTSLGLLRGIVAGLAERDITLAGCDLEISSDIPTGMGVSSSAAFEVAVGAALSRLWGCRLAPLDIAYIGLVAERTYFGKPCGMMDQTACALGGVNLLDFEHLDNPRVTHIDLPAAWHDYSYFLIDCGEGHAHTTGDFSRVATDMEDVARTLKIAHLHDISLPDYLSKLAFVRDVLGDGAALCALGFYLENALVLRRFEDLVANDMQDFIIATQESARISAEYLQNVSKNGDVQPAMVAQALCSYVLSDIADARDAPKPIGSVRIHGGGFGGTIQVIVLSHYADEFVTAIRSHLGQHCALEVEIGGEGVRWDS